MNYTIPRNNRELQRCTEVIAPFIIIPYQEIIGNYSVFLSASLSGFIIPYQEIIGNYSALKEYGYASGIIPYQEIIGNYSTAVR